MATTSADLPPVARYAVAVAVSGMAAGICYFLQPLVGDRPLLIVLAAGASAAAWLGGLGPGLLATALVSATAAYDLVPPPRSFAIRNLADAASIAILMLAGLLGALAIRHLRQQAHAERDARAEAERQLRQTDQLHQLTATLSRAGTPADVIDTSLPELLHAMSASAGAVFLVSEDGGDCELARALGYGQEQPSESERWTPKPESPLGEALRRRELVIVESTPAMVGHASSGSGETAFAFQRGDVVVPLVSGGRAVGAIALSIARALSGDDCEFLQRAARHTAQALDRARLYETAERARAEAEALRVRADSELRERQRAEEALRLSEGKNRALAARTSRLYSLSAGLSESVTQNAVARVMLRRGTTVVGAAAGSVALVVDGGTHFETLYAEEHGVPTTESQRRFPAVPGLCSTTVLQTGRPIFVGSFLEWQEKYPASASIAADGGYTSSAALPLVTDGSITGVLSFHFTVPVNFDEEYAELLMSVAENCAQALDRARLYETAERARAEAEAANRSKDDFLSTVSHELRTPLNAILGWAAMLKSGTVDASRTQRAIEAIYNNATRQGRLIEELLDVSRIVAGRASLDLQEVDLGENIRGAVEAMMPLCAAKGIELRSEITPGILVVADPRRLEQVFLNLLTNAVKFTPEGGQVDVQMSSCEQSVEVRVIDTGSGIEPSFLPHVFERFRQGDAAPTRPVGGLGLGLFISRQLVEAQGGTIRVESAGQGQGATFTVRLPTVATAAHPLPAGVQQGADADAQEPMPELHGVRVLLVDDEADAREVMSSALESCGATVISASSAQDALDTLARTEVDLLLSDIAMPGQDGYALIRDIRAMPSARLAGLPAAAVTAHARDDERDHALAAGFHMHLSKPVHPAVLARAVARLAFGRAPTR